MVQALEPSASPIRSISLLRLVWCYTFPLSVHKLITAIYRHSYLFSTANTQNPEQLNLRSQRNMVAEPSSNHQRSCWWMVQMIRTLFQFRNQLLSWNMCSIGRGRSRWCWGGWYRQDYSRQTGCCKCMDRGSGYCKDQVQDGAQFRRSANCTWIIPEGLSRVIPRWYRMTHTRNRWLVWLKSWTSHNLYNLSLRNSSAQTGEHSNAHSHAVFQQDGIPTLLPFNPTWHSRKRSSSSSLPTHHWRHIYWPKSSRTLQNTWVRYSWYVVLFFVKGWTHEQN